MALDESSRLFYYDARYDPLRSVQGPDAVFERTTGAYEYDGGLFRPRILNQPRVQPARSFDGLPAAEVLLEPSINTQVTDPAGSFASGGAWTHAAGITDSDAAASIIQGEAARELEAGTANQYIFQTTPNTFAGAIECTTDIFEIGSVVPDPAYHYGGIWDLDASVSTWVARYRVDLSDLNNPTATIIDGAGWVDVRKLADAGPNGRPVYVAHCTYEPTSGHARRLYWYPWTSGVSSENGRMIIHYFNVNITGYPHGVDLSDIGSVQAPDHLYFPMPFPRQPVAVVYEFTYKGAPDNGPAISQYLLAFGGVATPTDPRLYVISENNNQWWRLFQDDGTVSRNENLTVAGAKPGDRCRLFFRLRDASLQGHFEIAGGASDSGTDAPAGFNQSAPWVAGDAYITIGAATPGGSLKGPVGAQRLVIVKEGDLDGADLTQAARDELAGYYLDPEGRLIS